MKGSKYGVTDHLMFRERKDQDYNSGVLNVQSELTVLSPLLSHRKLILPLSQAYFLRGVDSQCLMSREYVTMSLVRQYDYERSVN